MTSAAAVDKQEEEVGHEVDHDHVHDPDRVRREGSWTTSAGSRERECRLRVPTARYPKDWNREGSGMSGLTVPVYGSGDATAFRYFSISIFRRK